MSAPGKPFPLELPLSELPASMLAPVTFSDEPDDRLRKVTLRPADEDEDDW